MRGKPKESYSRENVPRITPAHAGKTRPERKQHPVQQDHPRACGENQCKIRYVMPPLGSPPRMRGKRRTCPAAWAQRRITPAHAGKTFPFVLLLLRFKDHPRACGENSPNGSTKVTFSGSPPRMRGKLGAELWPLWLYRITPAHAGKTAMFPNADSGE